MTGKKVGYVRISTIDQNPGRQLPGIELDRKFIDFVSSSATKRPELEIMIDYLREGDELHIHCMDRLARNMYDMHNLINQILKKGVKIIFHSEGIVLEPGKEDPQTVFKINMFAAFAEYERAKIRERQREGIRQAKLRGKKLGPNFKLNTFQVKELLEDVRSSEMSIREIAEKFGITSTTVYRYIESSKQ